MSMMEKIVTKKAVIFLTSAITLRFVVYIFLRSSGYFYGKPWDTFSRTLLSYLWAHHPFFAPADGYWLPLQFWITGFVYALIKPWYPYSDILVPVVLNNIYFIGSLLIIHRTLRLFTNDELYSSSLVILSMFSADVFITYSGLSEPMLILFILGASYSFYKLATTNQKNIIHSSQLHHCLQARLIILGGFCRCSLFYFFRFGYSRYTKNTKKSTSKVWCRFSFQQ